jgi:hypothetical protein
VCDQHRQAGHTVIYMIDLRLNRIACVKALRIRLLQLYMYVALIS